MMRAIVVVTLAVAVAGCQPDKCASADLDCIIQHIVLTQGGQELPTRSLMSATLKRLSNKGGSVDGGGGVVDMRPTTPSAPVMIGCYVDEAAMRDLTGRSMSAANLTVESCNAFCSGYSAFAVEDRTWCYCGDQYGRYGAAPVTDCYMSCPGNTGETCGGFLRENVYTTGAVASADMSTGGGGGGVVGGGGPPTASTTIPKVMIPRNGPPPGIEIIFTDPNGCTPSFCFSACSPNVMCSAHTVCTHTQRDGLISGVWRSSLGTRYEPTEQHTTADFQVTPAATPDCSDFADEAADFEEGNISIEIDVEIGVDITIEADIEGPAPTGTGGVGAQCTQYVAECQCSFETCSDGTRGWYHTSDGQYFYCASINNCTGAATALTNYCCPKP
ncbi:MAG: copper radical oxidase [bacterium]|nr:copper radical oxidase [bacterium]